MSRQEDPMMKIKRLRQAAFMLAEDENSEDPTIKALLEKRDSLQKEARKIEGLMRGVRINMAAVQTELIDALKPYVREDLRDL